MYVLTIVATEEQEVSYILSASFTVFFHIIERKICVLIFSTKFCLKHFSF